MLKLKQQQKLALSPQLQQSMKILRMGTDELTDFLKKEALENPIIELEDFSQNSREALAQRKQEWLLRQESGLEKQSISYSKNENIFPFENRSSEKAETLEDYLMEQISYLKISPHTRSIMEYIAGSLDPNGFLPYNLEDLSQQLQAETKEITDALERMKRLEPIGVCSSGLEECLLLQLDEEDTIARSLVKDHLLDIAKKNYEELAELFRISMEELTQEIKKIQNLNPKPGRHFALREEAPYLTPDVLVVTFEEEFQIMLCDFYYPNFRMNEEYIKLSKQKGNEELKEYVNEGIQKFKWIKKSIESRNNTLLEIAREIVKHQKAFFIDPANSLNPLKMKDLAKILGVHESTISRGVKNKYLQCSHGVYPMNHFFITEITDNKGNQTNTDAVRRCLQELIQRENKKKPFSDNALCEFLQAEGFSISRRTVAKYRMELNIPASSERF